MTAPKTNPQRAGRKPGPRIPCGGCFAMLTAREWKGHFAHCTGKGAAKLDKLLSGEWEVRPCVATLPGFAANGFIVRHSSGKRIGPWRETPIEAVRDCPITEKAPTPKRRG